MSHPCVDPVLGLAFS
jgi:hypothetical protein